MSPINTDRNGINSVMGRMVVQALTVFSDLSRELRNKHGSVIDLCDEFENIMVSEVGYEGYLFP